MCRKIALLALVSLWADVSVAQTPDIVHRWNRIALDANALDHTPRPSQGAEQGGPGRSSRALAIVHIAIFDAVNAIERRYRLYTDVEDAPGTSVDAAVAQAAHDTLVALFPSQTDIHDARLAESLADVENGPAKRKGRRVGRRIARALLNRVADDGSAHAEPLVGAGYEPGDQPGEWRPDPISQLSVALGAHWGSVRPLVIRSVKRFHLPPPPPLSSGPYARAFEEVQQLGGEDSLARTQEQTYIGLFWAYDGTAKLGTPPRLYNQIAVQIADQMGTDMVDLSRLLALVNVSMSDAGIACWESKYAYRFWRPVTGIREADPGTGPTGQGDGNRRTQGDVDFRPLGAPASNLIGAPNFTPPFPAYPSGHATFGGAVFETLREFYGTDAIPFTFISDELNGETLDNQGVVRPLVPRSFATLSQAEEENGQSRIYLGIHWAFDKTAGIRQGQRVADEIIKRAFLPRSKREN